jgi:hypothetical protein
MTHHRSGWEIFCKLALVGALFVNALFSSFSSVSAQNSEAGDRGSNDSLIVMNLTEDLNGDWSSPSALIANPGPDGISLPEAIQAANNADEYVSITFDPSLSGSTLNLTHDMHHITRGNVRINGDINEDGTPDITIDGTDADNCGFNITGASNVIIRGFNLHHFPKHGIYIQPDTGSGKADVENIVVHQNDITAESGAIGLTIFSQDHASISNVEISSNNLHDSAGGGIVIYAGMGENASYNQISNVSIISNQIDNPGEVIDIFISPAADLGLSNNTISDVVIRGNTITSYNDGSILVDASNQTGCDNHTMDGLVISENTLVGNIVLIELVVESGALSTGNLMNDVAITDNTILGGGIHIAGSTGSQAHGNALTNLRIERNEIRANDAPSTANGIYLAAGADGAYGNSLQDVVLRDNLIAGFRDAGILLHGNDASSPNNSINNVTILNQTILNNAIGSSWARAIHSNTRDLSNTISNVTIKNAILWGNGGNDTIGGSVEPEVVTNTILNDARFTGNNDNFYEDPEFVDASSGDYHLQSTSPGVDTGDSSAALGQEDLDHHVRVVDGDGDTNAVVDIGAFEYNALAIQEIAILGNSVSILDGDTLPVPWDGTDIGNAEVGGDPLQATFTIQNTGESPLELNGTGPVEITGADAGDFSVVSQPDTTINGSQSATFAIEFTPSEAGLREAGVRILSNDSDESEFTFAIQGVGDEPPTAQEISIFGDGEEILNGDSTPSNLDGTDFGDVEIGGGGAQSTFTIQNVGDNPLELTGTSPVEITGTNADDYSVIAQPSSTVNGWQSVDFTIAFTPSASGLREAEVRILSNDSDESEFTFSIQGNGEDPPAAQEITIFGNGEEILNGNSTPSTLFGTDFGDAVIGGAGVQSTFTIQNTGDNPLELTGTSPVEITGANADDFSVVTQPGSTVNGGQSVDFTIVFTPSASGLREAGVRILSNDSDEGEFTFAIQGVGQELPTAQEISILGNGEEIIDGDSAPSSLDGTDFGNAVIGGIGVQSTFTIQNTGDNPLELTGTSPVEITGSNAGDFSVVTQPGSTIDGGQSDTFTIAFTPSVSGLREATVRILNNDSDESEFSFAIQGFGDEPPTAQEISIHSNGEEILDGDSSPSSLDGTDFGNAEIGGSDIQSTFTIQNVGDNPLELTGTSPVEITGMNAGDFSVVMQPDATVNGGQSVTFTITFAPSASGTREATVRILNNDSDEGEFTYAIQGVGLNPPEIAIKGKGLLIPDSDNTPSPLDGTDFGDGEIGDSPVQATFTIENTGEFPLELTGTDAVMIDGAHPDDFTVLTQPDTTINGGGTTTFVIDFSPLGTGHREARVHILNNDADEGGYNFRIQGNGVDSSEEEFFNFIPLFIHNTD